MNSCAWINGQYQWVGPQSQSSQTASQFVQKNQQTGTTNNSYQYRTLNFCNEASPRQMMVPRQPVFYLQYGGNANSYYQNTFNGSLPNSATTKQSGNSHLLVSDRFQGGSRQDFYQNSAQNSSLHSIMKANTTYPTVDMSAHQNNSANINTIVGVVVSDHQPSMVQKSLLQNMNAQPKKHVSGYTTTTLLSHEQVVCSRTAMSATAHNRQTAYYQKHRQSSTQRRLCPAISSTTCNVSVSQAVRNGMTSGSSSSGQISPASLNPGSGTQQEMVAQEIMIAKIADNLKKSFTSDPNDHSPFYISPQNSNASCLLNSGPSLPQTTHMLGAQHRVVATPQQSSVSDDTSVTTTESGNGAMAASALLHEGKGGIEGNVVGSLSDTSPLLHLLRTQSSVANNHEMLEVTEKYPSVMANDSPIHSSPGRTGPRAVAVVQPLSQEYYQAASKHTDANTINQSAECHAADGCSRNLEKVFISPDVAKKTQDQNLREESNLYPENPNQMWSNKSVKSHSPVPKDGPFLLSSDSSMHKDLSQKQFNQDDARSKPASSMQVASTAQQCATSEVTRSQRVDKHISKNATDPLPLDIELSSVPTIPWTSDMLKKLIQDDKTQASLEGRFTQCDPICQSLAKFWNGDIANLVSELKTNWYRDLMTCGREYLSKHLTSDSVILSQVKDCFQKHLQNYHVLKDDELYSEPPYKSTWLNINEQLDDIEKEFGFQFPLKHHQCTLESGDNPHHVKTGNSKPEQIVSDVSNEVLSLTNPVCDSAEDEQASTVETASRQTASPDKISADLSDPYYSFQIQVLPPEEAKIIFQQAQSMTPQSVDTNSQPETVTGSSMEGEKPEVKDHTPCDSNPKPKHSPCTLDHICCISKWMEIIMKSKVPGTECQCKDKQNHKDSSKKTPDKDKMEKGKLDAVRLNGKFYFAEEGKNLELKTGKNLTNESLAFSPNADFTEDNDNSSKKTNIPLIDLNSSQSSIIVISDNENDEENEDLLGNENEIPNLMADLEKDSKLAQMELTESRQSSVSGSNKEEEEEEEETKTEIQSEAEVDHVQDQLKSTESTLWCTLVCGDRECEGEEECGQAPLTSPGGPESSLETVEQNKSSETAVPQNTSSLHDAIEKKRKSHDNFFPVFLKAKKCKPPVDQESLPVLEDISKCKSLFLDMTDPKPSASNVRVVKLALFGSAPSDTCALTGSRNKHISSQEGISGPRRPPKFLSVTTTVATREYSVKQRIYEKWRRSLPPPTKIRRRSKLKTQKCSSSPSAEASLKKAEKVVPTFAGTLPVSAEMSKWRGKPESCLSLKWRRAIRGRLKHGEGRTKTDEAKLKTHANRETIKDENGSQGNVVLKFSVLPNTFNFKDGSKGRKETNDLVPDKPNFGKGKDESPSKTAVRTKDTWCPNPERTYRPLHSPAVPKTSILFHEFQKKYKEKKQPSMDE